MTKLARELNVNGSVMLYVRFFSFLRFAAALMIESDLEFMLPQL